MPIEMGVNFMYQHLTDKNLALDLVRVTEAAALAAAHYYGKGDKEAADKAAVDAMRIAFQGIHVQGTVVIGEGEKDHAPMLYNGEEVGYGDGPEVDVAVDPVEGTNAVANGRMNALSVVGMAKKGGLFNPGRSFYCSKIAVGKEAAGVIDINAPVKVNLQAIAKALGKPVGELNVFVLDKPRHKKLITDIRLAGARVNLHNDGDVAGALMACDPRSHIDVLIGTGGTPEAVITACALKGNGGQILCKFDPQSDEERQHVIEDGFELDRVLSVDDLVTTDQCFFAASGITDGEVLAGVRYDGEFALTSSLSTRGRTGTMRYVQAYHNRKKLAKMSTIEY